MMSVGTTDPLPCVGNFIILVQQLKGSVNFTRNWTEYKNRFGDFAGFDFWIGNENIYAITNRYGMAYMLRVEVCESQHVTPNFIFHSVYKPNISVKLRHRLHIG